MSVPKDFSLEDYEPVDASQGRSIDPKSFNLDEWEPVPSEVTKTFEQPQPSGNPVIDLVSGLYHGFTRRIPEQIGQTMQFSGIAPEAGKRLADWATEGETQGEKGAFEHAGEMIPASAGIPMAMAGAGKLINLIPHPAAKIIGTGLQLLPLGLTPFMFGASQAQQTLDTGNERLKSLQDQIGKETDIEKRSALEFEASKLQENLKTAPWKTGGIEALGETLGTLAFERALGPFAPAAPILKQGAKQIAKGTLGAWLKEMAFVTMPTEIGTEIGQSWGEAAVEKATGIRPEAEPFEEGMGVIAPTIIMTALMGGAGKAFSNYHANKLTKNLTNPEVDPQTRMEAASQIGNVIRENEENKAIADAWDSYAKARISSGLDIPLDTPMDELGLRIEGMEEQIKTGLGMTDDVLGEDARTKAAIAQRVEEEKRKALQEEEGTKPTTPESGVSGATSGEGATLTPTSTQEVPETTSVDEISTAQGAAQSTMEDETKSSPAASFTDDYRAKVFADLQEGKPQKVGAIPEKTAELAYKRGYTSQEDINRALDIGKRVQDLGLEGNERADVAMRALDQNFPVKTDTSPSEVVGPSGGVNASSNKPLSNAGLTDAQLFRDETKGHTIRMKGFDSLDVKDKSVVISSVKAAISNKEVLKAVVDSIPVDVMNDLVGAKTSPESILDNPSVLLDRLSVSDNGSIPVARFVDSIASMVKSETGPTTENMILSEESGRPSVNQSPTLMAGDSRHGLDILQGGAKTQELSSQEVKPNEAAKEQKEEKPVEGKTEGQAEEKIAGIRDRIARAYAEIAPGQNLALPNNIDHIQKAIETGTFNDLMHPMNKVSRRVFSKLTGIPLPKSLKATEALFTGKPFSLKEEKAAKDTKKVSQKAPAVSQKAENVSTEAAPKQEVDLSKKSVGELVTDIFSIINDHLGERGSISNAELTDTLYEKLKPYLKEIVNRAKAKALDVKAYLLGAVDAYPEGPAKSLYEKAAERYISERSSDVPDWIQPNTEFRLKSGLVGYIEDIKMDQVTWRQGANRKTDSLENFLRFAEAPKEKTEAQKAADILTKGGRGAIIPEQKKTEETKPEEQPAPSQKTDNEILADKLSKLRDELDRKGAGHVDGMSFSIQQRETERGTAYGYYWQKVVDGVRLSQGPVGFDTWSRDRAIDELIEEASGDIRNAVRLSKGLTYEEFAKQYKEAFEAGNKYTPDQAGFGHYAEKMANLADKYPEYLERFEGEVEEQHTKENKIAKPEESATLIEGGDENATTGVTGQETGTVEDDRTSTEGSGAENVPSTEGERETEGVPREPRSSDDGELRGDGERASLSGDRPEGTEGLHGERPSTTNGPVENLGGNTGDLAGVQRPADYRISTGELNRQGGWLTAAKNNLDAIELVKKLEAENRLATPEEQAVLLKYIGWGASDIRNNIFPGVSQHGMLYPTWAKPDWKPLVERLQKLFTSEELKTAARSTQYAHYTSEPVVRSIYHALERFGFPGGKILEPGMGIGHFFGLLPDSMQKLSSYTGIEMDHLTAAIAKQLYPNQNALHGDFIKQQLPNDFFDLAIGNPPFASTVILADPAYKKYRFALHEYFFAKSIDKVRPGGMLVFVTSRYAMDKQGDKARKYLADRADLIGAIRLPQTAFLKNAGTEVVTDVMFFRKRAPNEEPGGEAWSNLVEAETPEGPATVNEYYKNHPEMVLGRHSLKGSMYKANEYTVLPLDGNIEDHFTAAVEKLPKDVYSVMARPAEEQQKAKIERDFNPKNRKEGGLYISDAGKLMKVESGTGAQATALNPKLKPKDVTWLKDYVGLKDALKQAQYDQLTEGEWEKSLKALNKVYDAFVKKHGPINAFSVTERTFTDEDGNERKIEYRRPKNKALLLEDVENPLVIALEKITDDGRIIKNNFLNERTIKPPAKREIKGVPDALAVSLDDIGKLDLDHVAKTAGVSKEEAIARLGDLIYDVPGAGYQLADEYLSDNVVKKLEEAEAAARIDEKYKGNVEALSKVQPVPLTPRDVTVTLGANWIPIEHYHDFLDEVLDLPNVGVAYKPADNTWLVGAREQEQTQYSWQRQRKNRVTKQSMRSSTSEWGTADRGANEILEAVLNNASLVIKRTEREDGVTRTWTDPAATAAVNDIAKRMRERFSSWVWEDAERATALLSLYNHSFNNLAGRRFDGSHLSLPGISLKYKLYDHQKRAIWRIIQTGNTYLAHAVGAGKTIEMIAAGMEMKRLGLINKPLYVVPNHMLQQFANEFQDLYPLAHIMVADEENFHTDNRRRFVAQATLNKPDAIVMTHSSFELLRMKPETIAPVREAVIQELRDALAELEQDKQTNRIRISRMQKRIEQTEQRFDSMIAEEGKDNVVTFEEMGVDFLFVDEAHNFRKLDFTTNRQTKGIDPVGSRRAMDLYIKTQWLDSQKPGRSHVFASGTPVTNTLGELYSLMRFFMEAQMDEEGIRYFDAWANMFGVVKPGYEMNAAGRYEVVERFSQFVNVPELMSRVRTFMDVLTMSHLGAFVKRPDIKGGHPEVVITPASEELRRYQQEVLLPRIAQSKAWKPNPFEKGNPDPLINIITDGRLASLDMRFVTNTGNDPNSKLNKFIDGIIESYNNTKDNEYLDANDKVEGVKGSGIICFYNHGFGAMVAKKRGFDARAWFMQRLKAAGIPASDVAWIDDYDTAPKKEAMFKEMREGKKRILIGSAKKMGTGLNVQKRLIAEHYLDPPWYPSDVEQPDGRIIRQGNQNKAVDIRRYATKGSYDATMWQMVSRKSKFIEQSFAGDASVRKLEDISEASQYEMAAALASGDERAIQLAGLRADVERLSRLQEAHHQEQVRLARDKRSHEATLTYQKVRINELKEAVEKAPYIKDIEGKIGKQTFDKRMEFGEALKKAYNEMALKHGREKKSVHEIGTLNGHSLEISVFRTHHGPLIKLFASLTPAVQYEIETTSQFTDEDPQGLVQRIINRFNGVSGELRNAERYQEEAGMELAKINKRLGAPFEYEQELGEKVAEVAQLERELAGEGEITGGEQREGQNMEEEEEPSDNEPVFKLSRDISTPSFKYAYPAERKYSAQSVRLMIAPVRAKLPQSVRIQVVEDQNEIPISAERLSGNKIVGAYDSEADTIYIVARAIGKREDALSTLAHELIHRGLNGIFSIKEGKEIFSDVYKAYGATDLGRQILDNYGMDISTMKGKWQFSHELLAHMAETGENASLFQKIVGMIKAALRSFGISLNYTDADIAHIINKALAYDGRVTGTGSPGGTVAYSIKVAPYNELAPEEIPQQTQFVHKLMRIYPTAQGWFFPLYARPEEGPAQAFTIGKWYRAEHQRPNKGGRQLADRPGIHAVDLPIFSQGKAQAKGETRVWVLAEMPVFHPKTQAEANASPMLPNGQREGIKGRVLGPDEAYNYQTNPNATGAGAWPIAGSMKINRVLTDGEVRDILTRAGAEEHIANSMAGVTEQKAQELNSFSGNRAGNFSYKIAMNTDRAAHPEQGYHDSRPFKERLKESLGSDIGAFTKYFYNPFFKGQKIPEWHAAVDISENRREHRNEANHRYFSTIKDFFSLQGDSLRRVEKVLIEGDSTLPYIHADLLKTATEIERGGNKAAADRMRTRAKQIKDLSRYSDEELNQGIRLSDTGETIILTPKEAEIYKSVRGMFDTIHEDWYRNQMRLLMKPYRHQPWHTPFQNIFEGRDTNPEMKTLWKTLQRFTDDKYRGKKEETKQKKRDADAAILKDYIADISGLTGDAKINIAFKGMVDAFRVIRRDANAIRKARNRMGSWIAYFPRVRGRGKYFMNVYEVEENEAGEQTRTLVYNTAFNSPSDGEKLEREIKSEMRGRNIEVELGKVTRESEQSFIGATDTNLQRLLDNAIGRVRATRGVDPDTLKKIKGTMVQAIANELKSRGFGKAAIRRKWALIRGYETTGLQSVVRDYVTGFTGMSSKQEASFDFLDLLKGVDRKAVNLFEDLSKYSKDMLRNQESMDRISGKARGFAFIWYLGANIRPVLLQITQNYVTGMPFLAEQMRKWGMKGAAEATYHKAMFDAAKIRIDKNTGEVKGKNLTSWETRLIHEMLAKGIADDQYIQEVTGQMRNRLGKTYDRALKAMSYPFSRMEIFNRESAALAMFRTAWKHFASIKDEQERYDQAFDVTRDYIYKTHYAYGKENLPRIASGGDIVSVGARTALTFRSFTHNYVLSLISSRNWKTAAHSLAYVAMFGGLAGLPWFKDIFDLIERWTGYSPTKSARETMRKYGGRTLETMGMHGLPALAGANISGSLAIGIPFIGETPLDTVYGVMGGMAEKGRLGAASLGRGDYYRAVENMSPEFIASAMRALRMSEEGKALGLSGVATTQAGRPIYDESGKPLQFSSWEAALKSMGITPENYSVQTEAQRVVMGVKDYFKDWHDDIYEGFRIARNNKDQKAMAKTLRELHEYNQAIRDKGAQLLVRPMKLSNLVEAARSKMTPQQRREAAYKRDYIEF